MTQPIVPVTAQLELYIRDEDWRLPEHVWKALSESDHRAFDGRIDFLLPWPVEMLASLEGCSLSLLETVFLTQIKLGAVEYTYISAAEGVRAHVECEVDLSGASRPGMETLEQLAAYNAIFFGSGTTISDFLASLAPG